MHPVSWSDEVRPWTSIKSWCCNQEGTFEATITQQIMLQVTALAQLSPRVCHQTKGFTIAAEGLVEGLMRVCRGVALPILQQRLSSL